MDIHSKIDACASSSFMDGQQKSQVQSNPKHPKIFARTYLRNADSDYTEKIERFKKTFRYCHNQQQYWSEPEQSLLYGTPLYEEASLSQKLALNHLYWAIQYNNTAAAENNTVLYNQITSGVFETIGGYDTLCRELALETAQEKQHIHTFQKISYLTYKAILGKSLLGNSFKGTFYKSINKNPDALRNNEKVLRAITKLLLKNPEQSYSSYLREREANRLPLPTPTNGLGGRSAPPIVLQFLALNWGYSPFLACQFYALRFVANILLKNQEYSRYSYFRKLQKTGKFIPAPTAIANYHFLDESFHTTISQTISNHLYKDFPKPTQYERLFANQLISRMQKTISRLSGFSQGLPGRCFLDDAFFMNFLYVLLQSPTFDFSATDALHWIERCLCYDHEGFHVAANYHRSLVKDLRRFFNYFDYLWPRNRDLSLLNAEPTNLIQIAIQKNCKTFKQFSASVEVG